MGCYIDISHFISKFAYDIIFLSYYVRHDIMIVETRRTCEVTKEDLENREDEIDSRWNVVFRRKKRVEKSL